MHARGALGAAQSSGGLVAHICEASSSSCQWQSKTYADVLPWILGPGECQPAKSHVYVCVHVFLCVCGTLSVLLHDARA